MMDISCSSVNAVGMTTTGSSSTTSTTPPHYTAKRILVISNIITIAVTATAVMLALHFHDTNNNSNNNNNNNSVVETMNKIGMTQFPWEKNLNHHDDHDDVKKNRHLAADCCDCTSGLPLPTAAPTRAPTTDTPLGLCFPQDATVLRHDGVTVPLHSIAIGDRIHIGKNLYEPIYSFGHYQKNTWSNDFITMTTATTTTSTSATSSLTLSSHHMVYKCRSTSNQNKSFFTTVFIPAFQIIVGDAIRYNGTCVSVQSIHTNVRAQGFIAPFTPSGVMEINGYLVSNYVSLSSSERMTQKKTTNTKDDENKNNNHHNHDASVLLSTTTTITTTFGSGSHDNGSDGIPLLTAHGGAHVFEFPHRVMCYYLGQCPHESYTTDGGLSVWVSTPMKIGLWILEQSSMIQTTCLCLFSIVGICFSMMEFILFHNSSSHMMMMTMYYYENDDENNAMTMMIMMMMIKTIMIMFVVWKIGNKYFAFRSNTTYSMQKV